MTNDSKTNGCLSMLTGSLPSVKYGKMFNTIVVGCRMNDRVGLLDRRQRKEMLCIVYWQNASEIKN